MCTVWCSRERLPAAAAQPAKARQSCSASDYYYYYSACVGFGKQTSGEEQTTLTLIKLLLVK
jgi:hypothetical protein